LTVLLAIETTGRKLSAALACGEGARIIEKKAPGELNHLTGLVPMIRELLDEAGARLSSLDAIAVSSGPGSFTGIRIGISAARAIAQVTGLPVIKVPTLETFVYGCEPGEIVCPMLDARRGQVYAGAYRLHSPDRTEGQSLHENADKSARADGSLLHENTDKNGRTDGQFLHENTDKNERIDAQSPHKNIYKLETLVQGAAWNPDEFLRAVDKLGADHAVFVRDEDEPQTASKVLKWALAFGEPIDYGTLEPIYMRMAEAQRKLEERLAQERCGK